MASPPWIRLGGHVLVTPDGAGKARGTGLATCLRDLAAAEARRIRRERTRGQSCQVAAYAAGSPESRASFADLGHADRQGRALNLALRAGRIVLADWRPALSKEPGRLRPAILDSESFGPAYPGGVLVPITGDVRLGIATPSAPIPPSATNDCIKPFFALATHVTAASTSRIRPTESTITPDQLAAIRARIGIALGL